MSPPERVLEPALPRSSRVVGVIGSTASYRVPIYIACTVLALVSNYLLGKDMASDTLNYHLYAGFSAVNDRFGQEFPARPIAIGQVCISGFPSDGS